MRGYKSLQIALAVTAAICMSGTYIVGGAPMTPAERSFRLTNMRSGKTGSFSHGPSQPKRRLLARQMGLHTKRRGQRLNSL